MTAAAQPLSLTDISDEKILRLKQYPELLDALCQWVQFADRRLIPQMAQLGRVVKDLYDLPKELRLYRGFRLGSYQDSMGVSENAPVGQISSFYTEDRSLSFSTDESIAQGFGNIVVCATVQTEKVDCLVITDELLVLVHRMMNWKNLSTQHEVILLPPVGLQLKIVQKENTFGWLGW